MFSSSQCDYGPVSLVLALPILYTIISPLSCSAYPLSLPTHLRGVYVPRSSIYSLPDFSLNHSGNKLKAYIASIDFPVLVLVISNLSLMLQDPHLPLWCFHAHLQTTLSFHSLKWVFFFFTSLLTHTNSSLYNPPYFCYYWILQLCLQPLP